MAVNTAKGKWHEIWSIICRNFYSKTQANSRFLRPGSFAVRSYTSATKTIAANGSAWFEVSIPLDGYTPFAIKACYPQFAGKTSIYYFGFNAANQVAAAISNLSSSSNSGKVVFDVIYIKN